MPKFKCISCGEIKDSEGICSCPNCGYRMFEIPYDRKNVLISEVTSFITRMEVTTIKREDLSFEGKDKDEKRFPSYDKILKYVSGQDRTEDFLSNLLETAEQLRLHFTSEFSNTYPISFKNLDRIIRRYDDTLYAAAEVLASGCAASGSSRAMTVRKHALRLVCPSSSCSSLRILASESCPTPSA